ncbi:hypothetical protein HDV06_003795 [Boothiomyces sp. JEL0866]|nr:hypothetical protein HDV06_003795 [Boothiomyces sp. JEL0866]
MEKLEYLYLFVNDRNLGSTNVTGALTAEVRNWKSMTNLHIDNTLLKDQIPDEFQYLSNLTNMTMSYNSLDGVIPASLRRLKNAQNIDLRGNRFTGYDHELSPLISRGILIVDTKLHAVSTSSLPNTNTSTSTDGSSTISAMNTSVPVVVVPPPLPHDHDPKGNNPSDSFLLFAIVILVAILFAIFMFTLGKRKGKAEKAHKILSDYKLSRSLENDLSGGTLVRADAFRNSSTSAVGTDSKLTESRLIKSTSVSPESDIVNLDSVEESTNVTMELSEIVCEPSPAKVQSVFPSVAWSVSKEPSDITPTVKPKPKSLLKQVHLSKLEPAVSSLYTDSVLDKKFEAMHRASQIRKELSIWNEPISTIYVFANESGVDLFDAIVDHFFFPVEITFKAPKDIGNSTYAKISKGDIIEIHEHLYNGFFIGQNLTTHETDSFPITAYNLRPNTPKLVLVHLPERPKEMPSLFDLASKAKEAYPDKIEFMTYENFRALTISNIHNSGIFSPILNVGKVLLKGGDKMTVYMCNLFNDIASEFWTFVDVSLIDEEFEFTRDPYPLEFYDNDNE